MESDEKALLERLKKVEALFAGAATDGERALVVPSTTTADRTSSTSASSAPSTPSIAVPASRRRRSMPAFGLNST